MLGMIQHKKAVVKALHDKLACSDVLGILISDDLSDHDIFKPRKNYQNDLHGFKKVVVENDMMAPIMIPATFDLNDPCKLSAPYTNLIDNFPFVSFVECKNCQCYTQVSSLC